MACPANVHTGGVELCHQIVNQLLQFGVDAYMFYLPTNPYAFNSDNPVDKFYAKYHLPYVLKIEDNPYNVLILFEACGGFYSEYKQVQKIFYWMSVDVYIGKLVQLTSAYQDNPLIAPMPRFFYFNDDETEHWVQSEYARQFLKLNGVPDKRIYVVEDYLNQAFLSRAANIDISKKENIIAFNPMKGLEITKRLVELAPDMKWIPIKNMTPEQVQGLLASAKVYIDFGNHPGKDRIPREAAISGCVVITGKRGSAANDVDINIPAEFKFGETAADLPLVIEKIRDVFDNFESNHAKQNDYRARILDDKNRFAQEVAAAFSLTPQKKIFAAVAQGFSQQGVMLTNILNQTHPELFPSFMIDDRFCFETNINPNEFIKTIHNTNYFKFKKSGGVLQIMIISLKDAQFLYLEGRLNKFILLNPTAEELEIMNKIFHPAPEDLIAINLK